MVRPDQAACPVSVPEHLVLSVVTGSRAYGLETEDSDVDRRGVHLLPLEDVGLRAAEETVTRSWTRHGVEVDLVTHDLAKFCRLLLRRTGYVLEQLLSPLVVATSPVHEEPAAAAPDCLTRHHAHHYLGFARTQRLERDVARLTAVLEEARDASHLPETPGAGGLLHDLVVRARLATRAGPRDERSAPSASSAT
ncbi:nucleotidyltransferase domain-containing protein [Streptosporangium sandarakinum]|uniref:nucleotidyltransferase domain-containing protein n=1 Tax=Streptosporangium sandarakinum TaxID=1260955 RepID=UPI00343E9533